MALELNGTTGVSLVQDGVVTAADLASTLDLSGKTVTLPAGVGGKVLNVVSEESTTAFSTSSTSFVATTHTATITPSSTSSKIFIIYSGLWCIQAANTEVELTVRSNLNASDLGSSKFYSATASGFTCASIPFSYLHSPSSASAITYTVHAKEGGVPGTISTGASFKTLTLVEIAG